MVGPGARKPSVGEGIESRRPLFCSAITTLHSLFIYLFVLSFIFTFASILVCVNNNNNNNSNNNKAAITVLFPLLLCGAKEGGFFVDLLSPNGES